MIHTQPPTTSTRSPTGALHVFKFWLPYIVTSMPTSATNSLGNFSSYERSGLNRAERRETSTSFTDASASTQMTGLSTSPAMMSPTAQDHHRVVRRRVNSTNRTQLTAPLWHQFSALGAIHSFNASGASFLTSSGLSRLRGLRVTILRAISTLAILVLYYMTTHTVSNVGVFSPHTATSLYVYGSRLTRASTSTPSSRLSQREHIGAATRSKASIAVYPGPRMRFSASTIPMSTSVTYMDHCDHSMRVICLESRICEHKVLIDLSEMTGPELHCSMR